MGVLSKRASLPQRIPRNSGGASGRYAGAVIARSAAARAAASVILAGALLVGTAGCTFVTPQATLIQYDPSDGVGTDVGSIAVNNVLALISEDGRSASLLMTLSNSGEKNAIVNVQYTSDGEKKTQRVVVTPGESASFGNTPDDVKIIIDNPGVKAGQLLPVYIQYGDFSGSELMVPVLTGDDEHYADLVPENAEED